MTDPADKYTIRPLTRGELKTLRKAGMSPINISKDDPAKSEEIIEGVINMVLPTDQVAQLDNEPNPVTTAVVQRIMDATYGSADERKNSLPPGPGDSKATAKHA